MQNENDKNNEEEFENGRAFGIAGNFHLYGLLIGLLIWLLIELFI